MALPAGDAAVDRLAPGPLRQAFGAFATGVTVVTVGGPQPHGMTANSFTSVSLAPPLVLVCVARDALMHRLLSAVGAFGVSVLAAGQASVARHFADRHRGAEEFEQYGRLRGIRTGVPLIEGSIARFECVLYAGYDGGDHSIFVGEVVAYDRAPGAAGLVFREGRFSPSTAETTASS